MQIVNKITTLPAGQYYQFLADVEHDQQNGVTLSLTGGGTLVLDTEAQCAYYIAPPAVPNPSSVTVTVTAANGSGASDSDTFTITPAAGPVVSVTPAAPSVSTSADTQVTFNIAVTEDSVSDTLTPTIAPSSVCSDGTCGTFGPVTGTAGSGKYSVVYYPPSSVSASTIQQITLNTTLAPLSTAGTAFITINP
ncbi:MAG TPA: hypothetical protein VMG31_02635 [Verrucomicrobiae bacterium]|nr:hypothetical protein [Verrucomicrobiae bacterium]